MQRRAARVDLSKQLLVEGRDEELFFRAFLRHLEIDGVQVQGYMGKRNLGNFLIELVDSVGFDRVESIGIVRDADDSAASGLQSIQSHLRNVGLPVPPTFLDSAEDRPIISAFVMPNNAKNGALEALCLEVLQSDPAMDCVAEFFQCVSGVVTDPPKEQDKALIHAFLSSRKDPELRLGEAVQRGYIPWDNPAFDGLSQFLRSL